MTPNEILSQALVGRLIKDEYARNPRVVRVVKVELGAFVSRYSDWTEPYIHLTIMDLTGTRPLRRKLVFYKNEAIPFVDMEDTQ